MFGRWATFGYSITFNSSQMAVFKVDNVRYICIIIL